MIRSLVISIALLFLIYGCNGHKVREERNSFLNITQMPIQTPLQDIADAVFVNSIPNYQSFEKLFVYTFNASCSSCIAMAMDCFKAYKKSGVSIPFVFLSKEENREIFHYYYESEYGEEPPCYYSLESRELQDGIYTIEDYLVKFYNDWNQY